jgi:hypothetical protein
MILTQLVRPEVLARLTDNQISILNSVVEAEIIQNASIRKALSAAAEPVTKGLAGAPRGAAAAAKKK